MPDLLRNWRQQMEGREGQPATDVFPGHGRLPNQDEEFRRLRREVETLRQERDFLNKQPSTLSTSRDEVCRYSHHTHFSVALMCRVLGVRRAGFYAARKRTVSARAKRDEKLRRQIRTVHHQSRRIYGQLQHPCRVASARREAMRTEKGRAPDASARAASESAPP